MAMKAQHFNVPTRLYNLRKRTARSQTRETVVNRGFNFKTVKIMSYYMNSFNAKYGQYFPADLHYTVTSSLSDISTALNLAYLISTLLLALPPGHHKVTLELHSI
jgi:hypothetical protein